jgi:hypothetical protein
MSGVCGLGDSSDNAGISCYLPAGETKRHRIFLQVVWLKISGKPRYHYPIYSFKFSLPVYDGVRPFIQAVCLTQI